MEPDRHSGAYVGRFAVYIESSLSEKLLAVRTDNQISYVGGVSPPESSSTKDLTRFVVWKCLAQLYTSL